MRKHKGFTLVELVVVIMILGILAAVAAPKLLDTSSNAADNGIKQTLGIVRDAVERYAAEHGGNLPGEAITEADFTTDLKEYIRGQFPSCPVALSDNSVEVIATSPDNTLPLPGDTGTPSHSWKYCLETGEFIVNTQQLTNNDDDDALLQYDQL